MTEWYDSPYTGVLMEAAEGSRRPHDPDVAVWAGRLLRWGPRREPLAVSGAGWDRDSAEAACAGEAIERWQPYALPQDRRIETDFDSWPLDEPAVEPERWVLFHPEQYRQHEFPFPPFTRRIVCRWVCFREAQTGKPQWVPEDLGYLFPREGADHTLCPLLSTGLSCGRVGGPFSCEDCRR